MLYFCIEELCNRFRNTTFDVVLMGKKVSIYDLAAELNVSASTISRALHDHPAISSAMKERVRNLVQKMEYRPNHAAVSLKTGRVNAIAVVVPSINRNFFASVIEGIEDVVYGAGFDLLICKSSDNYEKEVGLIESLSQGKVDGIIASLAAETEDFSHYENLVKRNLPLVLFDRWVPIPGAGKVVIDDERGAYMSTEHLFDMGCRRVFHFAGDQKVSIWRNRYEGYRKAVEEHALKVEPHWVYTDKPVEEAGVAYARHILSLPPSERPDGIFFAGDYAAKGALQEFVAAGVRVPEDIAIVGFSNEPIDKLLRPAMSSVEQFAHRIGQEAARMIIEGIGGEEMGEVVIEPEFIMRESSQKSLTLK